MMLSSTFKRKYLVFLLTLTMAPEFSVAAAMNCNQPISTCNKAKNKAQGNPACENGTAASGQGACLGSGDLFAATAGCSAALSTARQKCSESFKQCQTQCKGPDVQTCQRSIQATLDKMDTAIGSVNAANDGASAAMGGTCIPDAGPVSRSGGDTFGGGGGGGDGDAGVAGAAPASTGGGGGSGGGIGNLGSMLGPLMMAAMMAKQGSPQPPTPMPSPTGYADVTGTIKNDGTPNCGTSAAYGFSACNQQLSQACSRNVTIQSTSPVCAQFSARYCNLGGYQAVPMASPAAGCPYPYVAGEVCGSKYFTTASPTAASQVNIMGEGVGTTYCLRALQISFCANAANAQCPSCLQLSSLRGAACTANPSLCNAMSSPSTIQSQLAQCPNSDPLLSVPGAIPATALAAGQMPGVAGATGQLPTAGALPPPVLPFIKNGLIDRSTASAGPARAASEVSGEFGPNLFMSASQPISQRCNAGKLLHCFR